MPDLGATVDERAYLHSLACFLAEDRPGAPPLADRASVLDQGVFSRYWFNWRPIGVTVSLLEHVSAFDFRKPTKKQSDVSIIRNHLVDRKQWTESLLSRAWLDKGPEGWFREYEVRNWTVLGLATELNTDDQKAAAAWIRLEDPLDRPLFANTPTNFVWQAPERQWLRSAWQAVRADRERHVVRGIRLDPS